MVGFLQNTMVLLRTATIRQSSITMTGSVINGILGALFYVVMARALGPADFGLLVVAITTLTLIADIVDFGTNTGLVHFVSANLATDKVRVLQILKLSLEIKLLVWLTVLLVGIVFVPYIADKIFNKIELITPLRLVMIGVGGALFFSFTTSSLQAFQKFVSWAFINISANFLRLVLIFLLLFYQQLNLASSLIVYISLPFLGFFLSLLLLPTQAFLTVKDETKLTGQLINFNRWVALSTIVAALSSRLDIFLTARLLSVKEVGIYSAANQLTVIIPQLVGALGVVAAPKFASFNNISKMLVYFKKFQALVLALVGIGLLVIPLSYYLIPIIFGVSYTASIPPFILLFLAMLVFLVLVPIHNSIMYYFAKPQVFVWLSFGHLLIMGILGYFMILNFGVIGAATTVLIGMIFNLLVSLIWFLRKIRQ